jgi:hypothetical protein
MEKKLNSFILSVFTIFLLAFVMLPLFLCLGKLSESEQLKKQKTVGENRGQDVLVDSNPEDCILPETADLGDEYIKKLMFLGESTTYGLQRYGVLPDGINTMQVWTGATCVENSIRCAGTLSLSPTIDKARIYYPESGQALTIFEAICQKQPEYLVITLGLNNGASYYSEDEFKQCYRILLNTIMTASSDVEIILQSLFPVAKTCQIAAYTPDRIALCNSWIQELAGEYEVKYLNTASVLSDTDGYLLSQYDNGGDGIHLNEEGLLTVLQYIRTHAHPKEGEV